MRVLQNKIPTVLNWYSGFHFGTQGQLQWMSIIVDKPGLSTKIVEMRTSRRADPAFQTEVACRLREVLRAQGLSQTEAARKLGITKQAFSKYLTGKTIPSSPVLAAAIREFGIKLNYRGWDVPSGAFTHEFKPRENGHHQLDLFDTQVTEDGVLLKIGSKSTRTAEVTVEIKFPGRAAGL